MSQGPLAGKAEWVGERPGKGLVTWSPRSELLRWRGASTKEGTLCLRGLWRKPEVPGTKESGPSGCTAISTRERLGVLGG